MLKTWQGAMKGYLESQCFNKVWVSIKAFKGIKLIDVTVGNPRLLCSHALDRVGCMQIYPKLAKSIIMDKRVFKNNKDIIENLNLENKATYL